MGDLANALLEHGVLGLLCLLLLTGLVWVARQRDNDRKAYDTKLNEVQEKRVVDAQGVAKQLLEVADRQNDSSQEVTEELRKLTAAVERRTR